VRESYLAWWVCSWGVYCGIILCAQTNEEKITLARMLSLILDQFWLRRYLKGRVTKTKFTMREFKRISTLLYDDIPEVVGMTPRSISQLLPFARLSAGSIAALELF
jgi:hypothetical protein